MIQNNTGAKIIGTYPYKHFANRGKIERILLTLKAYRETAKTIGHLQWYLFFTKGRFNKNYPVKTINTPLWERYKETCQWQVVGILKSFISNVQNKFTEVIINSSLSEYDKRILLYINKARKWLWHDKLIGKTFADKDTGTVYVITKGHLHLAKKIFKHILKKWKRPNLAKINMHLDDKVVKLHKKDISKAKSFDYWLKVSTAEKGKPVYVPLMKNSYVETLEEENKCNKKFLKFVQIVEREGDILVYLLKELVRRNYIPKTDSISIDIGLTPLIATEFGDLLGRKFFEKLKEFDHKIVTLQKRLQDQGKKPTGSKRYKKLVARLRAYLKNEIKRCFNKLIKLYRPARIIVEKLDFKSPHLSKRMNRLVQLFGKGIITEKLDRLKELYNIEIEEVNPAYTSQVCSNCGYVDSKNREDTQTFKCKACGLKINAQVNAARNIRHRSSVPEITIYTSKKVVLKILIERFLRTPLGSSYMELLSDNGGVNSSPPAFKIGSYLMGYLKSQTSSADKGINVYE